MKVITIGSATQDIFINYQEAQTVQFFNKKEIKSFLLLEEGAKLEITDINYATGGGATNSAVSFKRLGFDASPLCKIAHDIAGKFIIEKLQQEHIDITNIMISSEDKTGISYIIPSLHGQQTILAYRGINAKLLAQEIPYDLLRQAQQLYITSLSGESAQQLLPITTFAKKEGIFVANNPGISQLKYGAHVLRESLPYIDILILNKSEAQQFMVSLVSTSQELQKIIKDKNSLRQCHEKFPALLCNTITLENISFNLVQFFKAVLERGPHTVVVTNGAEGVYVVHKSVIYFHPSIKTEVISTLGAGDAFGSCFVASLLHKKSIEQAIVNGIINSHSVIKFKDAKKGLLTQKEVEEQFQQIGLYSLQKFNLI